MREIVLDTETTGLEPEEGHRMVEIGCVELRDHKETGNNFHRYLNPDRDVPEEAYQVHGLSLARLSGEPLFEEVADELLEYLGDAQLVIHNAKFDLGFLNGELKNIGRPAIDKDRVTDTIKLARDTLYKKGYNGMYNLDALANYYRISDVPRERHGALEDAKLLAQVYQGLLGFGEQKDLGLAGGVRGGGGSASPGSDGRSPAAVRKRELPPRLTEEELAEHRKFVLGLGNENSKTLWKD